MLHLPALIGKIQMHKKSHYGNLTHITVNS